MNIPEECDNYSELSIFMRRPSCFVDLKVTLPTQNGQEEGSNDMTCPRKCSQGKHSLNPQGKVDLKVTLPTKNGQEEGSNDMTCPRKCSQGKNRFKCQFDCFLI